MTREQMIDQAVRRFMKPISMRQAVRHAENARRIRRSYVPHYWKLNKPGPLNGADPAWWDGTLAEIGLSTFPGRVRAIRVEFRRLVDKQAHA